MDEEKLKDILQNFDAPPVDENEKKRALNLALAAFEDNQKKNEKRFQGLSLLARLMGKSNNDKRRTPMEQKSHKKLVYGGMATALAVVVVAGISMEQLQTRSSVNSTAELGSVRFNVDDSRVEALSPEYKRQLDTINEANVAHAVKPKEQPLERWRRIQDAPKDQRKVVAESYEADMAMPMSAPVAKSVAPMQDMAVGRGVGMVMAEQEGFIAPDMNQPGYYQDVGRDKFEDFEQNPFKTVAAEPVSTFSIDVDTSSYSFMRRQIMNGVLPQKDAIRIEEMVNYFDYDYPVPEAREQPFKPSVTVTPSPWAEGKKLIHIGIKGYDVVDEQPRSNLVFLLDVSGSMNNPNKLPLVVNSLKLLLNRLNPDDTIGIVVYAGAAGTVLEPTKVAEKEKIVAALENLRAGGSTAGAEGIRQAYNLAEANFDENAVNRVILATDGDFNVGITNREELKDFVERKRDSGIFLSVFGFGQGNLNDHMMQTLAQNGNGVAAYIDTLSEARKVLVEEATSTLFPIAKDVKIQVDFNPATVDEYRLVGYETRHLNREDFNNDAVDAGDIGAGHTVTAIYEITPKGAPRTIDESRYAQASAEEAVEETKANTDFANEYAFLKIRYKLPKEDTSTLITTPITVADETAWTVPECPEGAECKPSMPLASTDTGWATAVASFGELLKGGKYAGTMSYDDVIALAQKNKGDDPFGYRAEFIQLVRLAQSASAMQKN